MPMATGALRTCGFWGGVATLVLALTNVALAIVVDGQYQENKQKQCTGLTLCSALFSTVNTRIQTVSCFIKFDVEKDAALSSVSLAQSLAKSGVLWLAPLSISVSPTERTYQVHATGLNYAVGGASNPVVRVAFSPAPSSVTVNCTIMGN